MEKGYTHLVELLDKISKNEQFNYTRIQHAIPDVLIESYSDINNLIDDIIELAIKFKNPLVISSAGHPITANLSLELKNTNISSLDIGRGFDWNLKKYRNQWNEISGAWLNHPEHYLKQHINKLRYG